MQFEVRVGGRFVARVDAAYPDHRIAIEYDSYRHHGGRTAIDRDGARRSRLLGAGWLPFTATHAELASGCQTLAPALAVALRRLAVTIVLSAPKNVERPSVVMAAKKRERVFSWRPIQTTIAPSMLAPIARIPRSFPPSNCG